MIDTKLPLRRAYYELLNGNISVPVYSDIQALGDTESTYVLLSSQTSNSSNRMCGWASTDTMLLDIVYKAEGRSNKQTVDAIANEIFSLLLPSPGNNNLPAQPGIEIYNITVVSDNYVPISMGDRKQITRRLITFSQTIKQV